MSEVLDRAKSMGIRIIAGVVLAVIVGLYGLSGITHVELGEVGLSIKAVGGDRGSVEVLTPGTQWVEPFSNDVVNYDARLKQYALDDTTASTQDGQPINMDVSLEIGLVSTFVPTLHKDMGPNWFENVVYPSAITEIREATASVKSDEIYTGEGRAKVQALATKALAEKYAKSGIRIAVNVRDVTFTNKAYVTLLEQKAGASQQEIIQTRQAAAAVQEAIKVANIAEGQKQKRIKEAEAQKEEQRLAGEGSRAAKEAEAAGNLALALAEARGVAAKREALEGAGGERMVQLEWAKQLGPNVKVYAIPTGSPGTTSIMDLNGVLKDAFKGVK
jgi:regulator of protease activity HflC (stomatin/prohibitin superfamily)